MGLSIDPFNNDVIEKSYRHIWVDNANSLSNLYTNSPAMKTDVTLKGRRTLLG